MTPFQIMMWVIATAYAGWIVIYAATGPTTAVRHAILSTGDCGRQEVMGLRF